MIEVVFANKEEWQEFLCPYCRDHQTAFQVKAKKGDVSTALSCCINEECKNQAEKAARESVEIVSLMLLEKAVQ